MTLKLYLLYMLPNSVSVLYHGKSPLVTEFKEFMHS